MLRFIHLGDHPPPAQMRVVVDILLGARTFIDIDGRVWNYSMQPPGTWTQLQLGDAVPSMKHCTGDGNRFIGVAMDNSIWVGSPWLLYAPPHGAPPPIPIRRVSGALKWVSMCSPGNWVWGVNDANQIYCAQNLAQVFGLGSQPSWKGPIPGNLVNIAVGPYRQRPDDGAVFGANSNGRVYHWRGGSNFANPNWDDMNFPDHALQVANAQIYNDGSHGVWVLDASGQFWVYNTFHVWQRLSDPTDYVSFNGSIFVSRSGDVWIGTA